MLIKINCEKGQSLFEVVVAIGITALVLVAAVSLSTASVRNTTFAKNDQLATKYAQQGIEWLREQRDASWLTFVSKTGTSCLGSLAWGGSCQIAGTVFTRSLTFVCRVYNFSSPPPPTPSPVSCGSAGVNMIDTTVSVRWADSQGTHKVDSITTFTKWR